MLAEVLSHSLDFWVSNLEMMSETSDRVMHISLSRTSVLESGVGREVPSKALLSGVDVNT